MLHFAPLVLLSLLQTPAQPGESTPAPWTAQRYDETLGGHPDVDQASRSATFNEAASQTALELPPIFSDHMVIQRDKPVTIWGHAAPDGQVEVKFGDQSATAQVDTEGNWSLTLDATPATSTGLPLTVHATHGDRTEEVTLHDVVCGDVWLCAGQSNMRWRVSQATEAAELLEGASLPNLRLLDFEGRLYPDSTTYELEFLQELTAANYYTTEGWSRSTQDVAKTYSAVAFAFGRRLTLDLGVPIGLVHNAIGGVPVESYLPAGGKSVDPTVREVMDSWLTDGRYPAWCLQRVNQNLAAWLQHPTGARPHHPFEPSFLYEAGIEPLRRFPIKGVIWYQGESNATSTASGPATEKARNKAAFISLINGFREAWNDPGLPFYFVQLPGLDRQWPLFREMQSEVAREVPNTGMAVSIDLGHPTNVHPGRKAPVGERLARLALAETYSADVTPTGPTVREIRPQGQRLRIQFDHAVGLRTSDRKPIREFEVAGKEQMFRPAWATIDGDGVLVSSPDVEQPSAVRYAFRNDPDTNLVNGELLPASPFRSDEWPITPTKPQTGQTSFEDAEVGEFRKLKLEFGRLEAGSGHAAITDRFARTGTQCLHLLGGDDRQLTLTPSDRTSRLLSFWAERWTRNGPFEFRVEARVRGKWNEIYNGDKIIRVGARLLSHVQLELPVGTSEVRLRSRSPANSGVLIDDLQFEVGSPMRVLSSSHASWTAPALHGRSDNPVTMVSIATSGSLSPLSMLKCKVDIPQDVRLSDIAQVRVIHESGEAFGEPQAAARSMIFEGRRALQSGVNHFRISLELTAHASLDRRVMAACSKLTFSNRKTIQPDGHPTAQRIGVALRTTGQDNCHTYRIPGFATTKAGTLIAVYDNRYSSSGDLPGDIDVGMSRSTNGGRTWEPMRVIMDMGRDAKWRFDGIGDPAVLIDRVTGAIWVAATWSHGNRSWNGSGPGLEPMDTGQFMLVRSDDDGLTWTKPINITHQVKDPAWRFVLQGPGKGITLRDGTLVFPAQFRSSDASPFKGKPFSTLIWSKDRGETWNIGTGVKADTTEAQVVELGDGTLMINCRDNRRGSRSVYTTQDLGSTWQVHSSSRSALPEPTCMASLIRLEHEEFGPLLMFSNPATRTDRRDMTLKVSRDEGHSWPTRWHTLYDQRPGFGYSCLTRIDEEHIGVLYEGRREIYFLRLSIRDLIPTK